VGNFIEMTEDEWFKTYKPIPNHIDKNASFSDGEHGYMFETYGDEIEFVKSQSPDKIWMYGDGDDGGLYIWSGWGFVNRLGYFITEVPCPPDTDIQRRITLRTMLIGLVSMATLVPVMLPLARALAN